MTSLFRKQNKFWHFLHCTYSWNFDLGRHKNIMRDMRLLSLFRQIWPKKYLIPIIYCMLNILMYNLLVLVKNVVVFFFFLFFFFVCVCVHLSGTHNECFSEVSPVSCITSKTYGPGSDKRYLRGIKVKIKMCGQMKELALMNISWKF